MFVLFGCTFILINYFIGIPQKKKKKINNSVSIQFSNSLEKPQATLCYSQTVTIVFGTGQRYKKRTEKNNMLIILNI